MARGKKITQEDIEAIMTAYSINPNNISEVARSVNRPASTVRDVIKKNKDDDRYVQLREKKKDEFVDKATRIINLGTDLLEKRMKTALNKAEEIELTMDYISGLDDDDVSYKEKLSMLRQMNKIQLNSLNEITTAIGTMYDKRALSNGESTTNETITIKMSDEVRELSG